MFDEGGTEPGGLGLDRPAGSAAKPDDNVDLAVLEIERLGAALVAIAEDRNALARERGRVDVGVAEKIHKATIVLSPWMGEGWVGVTLGHRSTSTIIPPPTPTRRWEGKRRPAPR